MVAWAKDEACLGMQRLMRLGSAAHLISQAPRENRAAVLGRQEGEHVQCGPSVLPALAPFGAHGRKRDHFVLLVHQNDRLAPGFTQGWQVSLADFVSIGGQVGCRVAWSYSL